MPRLPKSGPAFRFLSFAVALCLKTHGEARKSKEKKCGTAYRALSPQPPSGYPPRSPQHPSPRVCAHDTTLTTWRARLMAPRILAPSTHSHGTGRKAHTRTHRCEAARPSSTSHTPHTAQYSPVQRQHRDRPTHRPGGEAGTSSDQYKQAGRRCITTPASPGPAFATGIRRPSGPQPRQCTSLQPRRRNGTESNHPPTHPYVRQPYP